MPTIRWFATRHVPHGWECSMAFEETTRTLLCGDLFTQAGDGDPALTEGDILESSEAFRPQSGNGASSATTGRLAAGDAGSHAWQRMAW